MKLLVVILSFLPFAGFAQQSACAGITHAAAKELHPVNNPVTCLHYDTATINGPVVVSDTQSEEELLQTVREDIRYRGHVSFKTGFTTIGCAEAVTNENQQSLIATKVTLSCLLYPILKGERLVYNKATGQAVLYGPISISDKGTEKILGKIANLDLSKDQYTIVSIR